MVVFNGVQIDNIFFNGISLSKVIFNGIVVFDKSSLKLVEVIFNESGIFTVPSNAINNTFYVGCTGGGSVGYEEYNMDDNGSQKNGGFGSGRKAGTFILSPGNQIVVTVGSGGTGFIDAGDSTFGNYLSSAGVINNGDGAFSTGQNANCPALLSLISGAIDTTSGLWKAQNYLFGGILGGGAGCYGNGAVRGANAPANSGAGGGAPLSNNSPGGTGGSGKVVIYYYIS